MKGFVAPAVERSVKSTELPADSESVNIKYLHPRLVLLLLASFVIPGCIVAFGQAEFEKPQVLSLSECLQIAMEKNHSRPASQFAVAIAEAQHRQALAGYWPQVNAKGGVDRMSDAPNFMYPASTMYIPAQSVTVPGGTATVTIPANAFGPGFPPVAVQMPVAFPGQTVSTNVQMFPIPAQDVKLMSPTTESVSGDFKWLLEDGEMRRGYREQARASTTAPYWPGSFISWARTRWSGWKQRCR